MILALPPALAPLGACAQFILVHEREKWPVDWRTLEVADAHNPAIWLDAPTALKLAQATGKRVGFVFTAADPFWFLDLDKCLGDDGQWSDTAQRIFNLFPRAAKEVSTSGRGAHVIGTGTVPPHSTRCAALGMELYDSKRFVLLTGVSACGDASADESAGMALLVPACFPPRQEVALHVHWTDGPVNEWRGPTDDDDLIRRALQAKGAASTFGGKASFADLWDAKAEALGRSYPDANRAYDASAADAALAQHLAFWTGNDCARIERLMRRSALVREKWDSHSSYMQRTIFGAVAQCTKVCQDKVVAPPLAGAPAVAVAGAPAVAVAVAVAPVLTKRDKSHSVLSVDAQIEYFRGCVYVIARNRVLVPGGDLLSPERFKAVYGGHIFAMDLDNSRFIRNAFEAFTESPALACPKANDVIFRPDLPPAAMVSEYHEDGSVAATYVNSWVPVPVRSEPGDVTRMLDAIARMCPAKRDQDILIDFMAAMVQYPGVKFQYMIVLQGVEGNGKTLLAAAMEYCVGKKYTHWVAPDKLAANFNGWMPNKLLAIIEEIRIPNSERHIIEKLKPLIAGSGRVEIEAKGIDQVSSDICLNWFATTNYRDGMPKSGNDRRICPLFSAQQEKEDLARDGITPEYMRGNWNWFKNGGNAHWHYFLAHRKINDEFNPALGIIAPITSSTEIAIAESRGVVESEIQEASDQDRPGFRGGYVSSTALDSLIRQQGIQAKLNHSRRGAVMRSLGYVRHPGLPDGRVPSMVMPDAGRPRLYIKIGHPDACLTGLAAARAYTAAQLAPLP